MKLEDFKPKERFSNRAENYVKYRPHYPIEILDFLKKEICCQKEDVISDIGSGTGILSELFLKNGNVVFGVEPNKKMREAGKEYLKNYENFKSNDGSAENTGLANESIDMIVVGQAFHWFDVLKCKTEFQRILKNKKNVLLIWNERILDDSGFMSDYESIIQKCIKDYGEVTHRRVDENKIKLFFSTDQLNLKCFHNSQKLDFDGLMGRTLSASYTPTEDSSYFNMFREDLKNIFSKFQKGGIVEMIYKTKLYWGNLY
jgi:SAM-dependent methyltransferase